MRTDPEGFGGIGLLILNRGAWLVAAVGLAAGALGVACGLPLEGTGLLGAPRDGGGDVRADVAMPIDASRQEAGTPEAVVEQAYPVRAMGITDTALVWATSGMAALHVANLDGGGQQVIESLPKDVSELVVAPPGGPLYYTDGDLHEVQLDGTGDMLLLYGTANACLQVTGHVAYLVNGGNPPEIDAFDVFAGTRTPLVGAPDLIAPWGVAVTATDVYWSGNQHGRPDGGIWRRALDGGMASEIVPHLANPNCITVFDGALWWPDSDDGTIRTGDLSGGGMRVVATGQDVANPPTTVVVDARFVYWNSGKRIMRLAR